LAQWARFFRGGEKTHRFLVQFGESAPLSGKSGAIPFVERLALENHPAGCEPGGRKTTPFPTNARQTDEIGSISIGWIMVCSVWGEG
jgi:hypothetical protein